MFCVNVLLTANNESDVPQIAELLRECGRLSRSEPGCIRYEVCHSRNDPRVFLLCERWESEQAWQAHRQERAFQEIYQPRVLPLVERVPHPADILE